MNRSKRVDKRKSADDRGYGTGDLHLSFEYSLKWKSLMYTRHSSELQRASKKRPRKSPSRNVDPPQRLLRSKRRRAGLRTTDENTHDEDVESGLDIVDLIGGKRDKKRSFQVEEGGSVEVYDGVDNSDEESSSMNSSVDSGPSRSVIATHVMPESQSFSRGPCPSCLKLYRNAKRLKRPIKDKLLDNDPSSLTCDQWVLLKRRRRGGLPNAPGKLSRHLQLVKGRLERSKHHLDDNKLLCSRPHVFLQRNLRRCVEVPVKKVKKNRRKRARDDCHTPRISKQKRLHRSECTQPISTDDSGISSASCLIENSCLEASSIGQKADSQDIDLTVETIPSTGNLESCKPQEVLGKQGAPKKAKAFRDLLTQLRGSSSMIVNESHY